MRPCVLEYPGSPAVDHADGPFFNSFLQRCLQDEGERVAIVKRIAEKVRIAQTKDRQTGRGGFLARNGLPAIT